MLCGLLYYFIRTFLNFYEYFSFLFPPFVLFSSTARWFIPYKNVFFLHASYLRPFCLLGLNSAIFHLVSAPAHDYGGSGYSETSIHI